MTGTADPLVLPRLGVPDDDGAVAAAGVDALPVRRQVHARDGLVVALVKKIKINNSTDIC